jgi:hypothetical protein
LASYDGAGKGGGVRDVAARAGVKAVKGTAKVDTGAARVDTAMAGSMVGVIAGETTIVTGMVVGIGTGTRHGHGGR